MEGEARATKVVEVDGGAVAVASSSAAAAAAEEGAVEVVGILTWGGIEPPLLLGVGRQRGSCWHRHAHARRAWRRWFFDSPPRCRSLDVFSSRGAARRRFISGRR